jgi:hypothetical protein
MKHYLSGFKRFSNPGSLVFFFLIIFCFHQTNAQKLLFPDEFQRLPESDPGAEITAKVLPNSNNQIFYGTIGSDNVVWVNGEPTKLEFPGTILETNTDFSYVKGEITPGQRYYVFKDGEYTYIDINYASNFSNLDVRYFSDDGTLIIGTATKSEGFSTSKRAVRIMNGSWQVIGEDPPVTNEEGFNNGSSEVIVVAGENGSVIIGTSGFNFTTMPFRMVNGSLQNIPGPDGTFYVRAASPDGNTFVGNTTFPGYYGYIPVMWKNGSFSDLGQLPSDFNHHFPTSVNNEGTIVSGYAAVAFIWIEGRGLMNFADFLSQDYGVTLPGLAIRQANLSDDKTFVSGKIRVSLSPDFLERDFILVLNETDDRIVVNSVADRPLNVANNTDCSTGEQVEVNGEMVTECTLRAALQAAINRYSQESDESLNISFQIPGTEAQIVAVSSPLPDIAAPIEIDGNAHTTNQGLPLIYIDGQAAGAGVNGFNIMHNGVTLKSLAVYGFDQHGIYVADVEDIRLEGLIVGTDAEATSGIGNGGDGIHISGNAKVKVGGSVAAASPLASENLGTGVATLGNGGHGIAVVSTDVDKEFSILKSGRTEPVNFQTDAEPAVQLFNLQIGLLKTHETKELENKGAGTYAYGSDFTINNAVFGPSGGPGFHVVANESAHAVIQGASFGKKSETVSGQEDIVVPQPGRTNPAIKIERSRGIMIGSPNPENKPIEAIGSPGFFVEIEDSEDIKLANVITGAVENIQNISGALAQQMKNQSGGVRIENSNRVTIGEKGLPTIIANSGTPGDSLAAGIVASGPLTKALKIINAQIGEVDGLENSGISGDGIRIENGVSEFTIGGEDEEETVVVAGNAGAGIHIVNNNETNFSETATGAASLISNLVSDMSVAGLVESAKPNKNGAVKIVNSANLILKNLSIGPTEGHGIELAGNFTKGVEILKSSIGSMNQAISDAKSEIAGPKGDGIHISGASDIRIGNEAIENAVRILGSSGKGIAMMQSKGISMSHVHVGDIFNDVSSGDLVEALQQAGNKLGGIFMEASDSVKIINSRISNNGSDNPESFGGMFAKISGTIQVHGSSFGIKPESGTPTGNLGAAILANDVQKIILSANKVAGNISGVIASMSNVEMDGNIVEEQIGGDGESGHGVSVKGGYFNAIRNIIQNNPGAGIYLEEALGATVRVNNIISNAVGGLTNAGDGLKSAAENGSLVYAGENWWGDASGPGGDGPGTGNAVSGDLDYSNWLNAPFGVTVVPKEHLISLTGDQEYSLPVSFANHQDVSDQLNVTISDSLGWYSGSNSFSVPVENFEYSNESLSFNPVGSQSNINVVRIEAVSQNNPDLTSEVKIYFVPPANILNLENPSLAETNILDTESGPFQIGDEIIIGHGLANEETATIAEFGSIILENPLRFSHAAGERIFTVSNLYTSANEIAAEIPDKQKTVLGNNYPNPFSDKTHIPFNIDSPDHLEITVLDKLGRTVQKLANEKFPAGKHEVTFEGSDFPAGMYFYQIKGSNIFETRKMIISR